MSAALNLQITIPRQPRQSYWIKLLLPPEPIHQPHLKPHIVLQLPTEGHTEIARHRACLHEIRQTGGKPLRLAFVESLEYFADRQLHHAPTH